MTGASLLQKLRQSDVRILLRCEGCRTSTRWASVTWYYRALLTIRWTCCRLVEQSVFTGSASASP